MAQFEIGNDCPVCGAVWGLDEMQEEKCFCCGYPDVNENNFEDEDNDLDDYDWADEEMGEIEQF